MEITQLEERLICILAEGPLFSGDLLFATKRALKSLENSGLAEKTDKYWRITDRGLKVINDKSL